MVRKINISFLKKNYKRHKKINNKKNLKTSNKFITLIKIKHEDRNFCFSVLPKLNLYQSFRKASKNPPHVQKTRLSKTIEIV